MQQQPDIHKYSITWRGMNLVLEMNPDATLKSLGDELQRITNVKADTMRLIVPSNKNSKLLYPFSEEHSHLKLEAASILERKPIRMLGIPEYEVDEMLKNAKADLRIAGFDEEESRSRQRMLDRFNTGLKLPQGPYVFCDFQTLHLPGIVLNPPASEALKLMHKLAADPGIVAVMNKHHWRVGIMTEMAPVGYVGVSPKCILGLNKNHGEEISLRLRTDDLKGFRKYERIKKTLLHELAHMVHSEHDANFYALDSQLNREAATLDWTKSRSYTLTSVVRSRQYDEEVDFSSHVSSSQKVGGAGPALASPRASSVAAAYHRLANTCTTEVHEEPDPDDNDFDALQEQKHKDAERLKELGITNVDLVQKLGDLPNSDQMMIDEQHECTESEPSDGRRLTVEPDPDDIEEGGFLPSLGSEADAEPDPDDLLTSSGNAIVVGLGWSGARLKMDGVVCKESAIVEPDPDDSMAVQNNIEDEDEVKAKQNETSFPELTEIAQRNRLLTQPHPDDNEMDGTIRAEPDPDDSMAPQANGVREPDSDDSHANGILITEPDPDDYMGTQEMASMRLSGESDLDDQELQRIQDPVAIICTRLQNATEVLRTEVNPSEAATIVQTLIKIIRNVIEHPDDMKFKKLRKANPIIQRHVINCRAATQILNLIGFSEDVIHDAFGKAETFLVLKRNDLGLLWLAKSTLETSIA